jgi:predicted enzyme related to lactoylglutathione lyase
MILVSTLATDEKPKLERVIGMLAHTELASSDPEATRSFIGKVFDWELEEMETPSGKLIRYTTPGGARGSIRATGPKEIPGTMNYILVDDIDAMSKRIKEAGGEIIMPIVDVPKMGRFFWFKVPGGPVLAAWQDAPKED